MSGRMTALVALWTLPCVGFSQQHEHGGGPAAEQSQAGERAGHGPMHEHMEAMRQQMDRIRVAATPEERERLMHEHMQSMMEHMRMMGQMGREAARDEPARGARCTGADMPCRMQELTAQSDNMARRMDDMQKMLEQLMEHMRAVEPKARNEGARRARPR